MKELDSKSWRAFHKIGTSLLPHLSRQITNHSGISAAEYVVLVALSESKEPSMNLNRLSRVLGWEISRMSHQVSRMEDVGLVKKTKNLDDSRCFDLSITSKGRKIAEAAIPLQSKEINHCFRCINSSTNEDSDRNIRCNLQTHERSPSTREEGKNK